MLRFLAGAASSFLLMSGAFLIWQSRAAAEPNSPPTKRKTCSNERCAAR